MNIVEEFWYGNLEPAEYDVSTDPEYKELLQRIIWNEEKLKATRIDSQKELFSRYTDCVRNFQSKAACMLFRNSFHPGARMMLEVMEER